MEFDGLSSRVIRHAIEGHREPGPGLLESTHEECPAHELKRNGIAFRLQFPHRVEYEGIRAGCGCLVGALVENTLMLESKSAGEIKGHSRGSATDQHEAGRRRDRVADQLCPFGKRARFGGG
jgi:GxxExxY protein